MSFEGVDKHRDEDEGARDEAREGARADHEALEHLPRRTPKLFGGMTASEAGQKSNKLRREREAALAERPDSDITPTDEEQVIARLKTEAKGGNVQAARELREWLRDQRERAQGASSIDTATTYAQLSPAQRLELRARLLREALALEGAQGRQALSDAVALEHPAE